MDAGRYTFALTSRNFQRDVLAGRAGLQLNVDATRMSQAFTGSGYVQQIWATRSTSSSSVPRHRAAVDLALRARFNPSLDQPGSAA
jgi:ABC-2 type transport system permease protein